MKIYSHSFKTKCLTMLLGEGMILMNSGFAVHLASLDIPLGVFSYKNMAKKVRKESRFLTVWNSGVSNNEGGKRHG